MTRPVRRAVPWPALLSTLFLLGCEGDSGPPGPAGPPGPPGPPGGGSPVDIAQATGVTADIDGVTIASPPVVRFSLGESGGRPVTGLPASAIGFAIAKLVPGANGNPSRWQSYIERVEQAGAGPWPGTGSAVQAATENGSAGTLVDNGDGSYSYTFATDVTGVPGVPYEPALTHRVGFEIRGFGEIDNPVYDWRPSTGATSNLFMREIVKDATCNVCHDKLALHGGARFQNQYCVVCHNPGSTDAQSGNSVDMTEMIHKIHHGANLPSVQAGGEYAIWGFRNIKHDYSDVVHPQDIRNCRSCHDENDPETPDAINWIRVPSIAGCGSCHDDVDFQTGANHATGLPASNSECTICHAAGGPLAADVVHRIPAQTAAQRYEYNILDISDTAPGEFPVVRFSVTDPTNNDQPYDILNDAPFTQGMGRSRLSIDIAWDLPEIDNRGSGSGSASGSPAQPIQLNPLFGGSTPNGDGSFTVNSSVPIPATATNSGIVAMEGHPNETLDGVPTNIPVTGTSRAFAITDGVPVPRREVVALARCNDCHESLSLHGSNRTDDIGLCLTCHNPNATDIARRVQGGADSSNSPDGKDEATVGFKYMIHAIHAGDARENPYVAYNFFGQPVNYGDVVYPGRLADCTDCHEGDTYYPVGGFALATTTDSGANLDDPFDDINTTPNAAACESCHDDAVATAHMRNEGGAFDAMQTEDGTLISASRGTVIETCDLCHGPGRSSDVALAHGLD